MNSFNHYAYGAVGQWMYTRLAGLEMDPEVAGFRRIVFRPELVSGGGISWARATLETPYGVAESGWKWLGDHEVELRLRVPPNATGKLILPGVLERELLAGVHEFILNTDEQIVHDKPI